MQLWLRAANPALRTLRHAAPSNHTRNTARLIQEARFRARTPQQTTARLRIDVGARSYVGCDTEAALSSNHHRFDLFLRFETRFEVTGQDVLHPSLRVTYRCWKEFRGATIVHTYTKHAVSLAAGLR